MKYEVKIGILAIVAIALAFWGFKFIQGTNLLSSSKTYYVNYDNVAGLTVGTPVQISGVNVGSVSKIQLDQQTRLVKVELDIRDEINVPKETKAYILSASILGEKAIDLTYTNPCFGNGDCAPDGTLLEGAAKGMLEELLGLEEGSDPLADFKGDLGSIVDTLNHTLFSKDSDNPIARSIQDLAQTMENLKYTSARLQRLMDSNSGEINKSMENIAEITTTLAGKQEALGQIIENAKGVSGKLNQIELEETVNDINGAVKELKSTITKANGALDGVAGIMVGIENGEGTLGKLLTSDDIYNRLNSATLEADTLLSDLQERPYRYVPFKSRRKVLKHDRKDQQLENVGPKE